MATNFMTNPNPTQTLPEKAYLRGEMGPKLHLPLPTRLDEERRVFLRDEQAILDIGNSVVGLGLEQEVVVLAQVDDPAVGWTPAGQETRLKRLKSQGVVSLKQPDLLRARLADPLSR